MQDVYDRNLTIYLPPAGNGMLLQVMSKLPFPYPELAESIYITDSMDEFDNIAEYDVLEKESFYNHQQSALTL